MSAVPAEPPYPGWEGMWRAPGTQPEASPLVDSRYSLFGAPGALRDLPRYVAARVEAAGP